MVLFTASGITCWDDSVGAPGIADGLATGGCETLLVSTVRYNYVVTLSTTQYVPVDVAGIAADVEGGCGSVLGMALFTGGLLSLFMVSLTLVTVGAAAVATTGSDVIDEWTALSDCPSSFISSEGAVNTSSFSLTSTDSLLPIS